MFAERTGFSSTRAHLHNHRPPSLHHQALWCHFRCQSRQVNHYFSRVKIFFFTILWLWHELHLVNKYSKVMSSWLSRIIYLVSRIRAGFFNLGHQWMLLKLFKILIDFYILSSFEVFILDYVTYIGLFGGEKYVL